MLLAFGRMGLLGEHWQILGVQLSFTTAAVVLVELFVATHFYVRQAAVGFGRVDHGVEEAAMVDGASRMGVFSSIIVPLVFPAPDSSPGRRKSEWAKLCLRPSGS